jgi:PleD family two-component response regulator
MNAAVPSLVHLSATNSSELIESEGSTFHTYLPALESEAVTSSKPASPRKREFMEHSEVILLVDDNQNIIQTGKDVLESLGYRVFAAINGRERHETKTRHSEY